MTTFSKNFSREIKSMLNTSKIKDKICNHDSSIESDGEKFSYVKINRKDGQAIVIKRKNIVSRVSSLKNRDKKMKIFNKRDKFLMDLLTNDQKLLNYVRDLIFKWYPHLKNEIEQQKIEEKTVEKINVKKVKQKAVHKKPQIKINGEETDFLNMCKAMNLNIAIFRKLHEDKSTTTAYVRKVNEVSKLFEKREYRNYLWHPNYFGITNQTTLDNLKKVHNIVIDVDSKNFSKREYWEKCEKLLNNEEDIASKYGIPIPTFVSFSGNGLHFYYTFSKPVSCVWNEKLKDVLRIMQVIIQRRLCNYLNGKIDNVSLVQGFRVPGSVSKRNTYVKVYKMNNGFCGTLDELALYLMNESDVLLLREYACLGRRQIIENLEARYVNKMDVMPLTPRNYYKSTSFDDFTKKDKNSTKKRNYNDRNGSSGGGYPQKEKKIVKNNVYSFTRNKIMSNFNNSMKMVISSLNANLLERSRRWAINVFNHLTSSKISVGTRNMRLFGFSVVLAKCGAVTDFIVDVLQFLNRTVVEEPLDYREIACIANSSKRYIKMRYFTLKRFLYGNYETSKKVCAVA